ncbi:uncharacterized protein LOC128965213 [Oppia nitens]|uniref:uncharacterized protein LOC128965213 n=1 Tax=Oppia nitens TaxID=1686743 RepID=UPI0023DA7BDC|nr:uncharacterized protein LOC128965213 [Oppia nitens]
MDNLYDYCTEQYWRDFPGHRTIPVDKSIQIRSPYIFSFNNAVQNQTNRFVHYCRIRLIVGDGKRIYAVGTSSGISTNGNKKWITESIHMSPTKPKLLTKLRIKEDFESTTDNNALELVFEGLDRQEFRFQLVVTPFRQLGNETKCERHVEYKCRNNRCVDAYLVCDYRNNCGDDSDEWHHCLAKLPTTGRPPTRLPTPVLTPPPVYWWPTLSSTTPSPQLTNTTTGAIDDSLNNTLNYYLFHSKLDLRTVVYYILFNKSN